MDTGSSVFHEQRITPRGNGLNCHYYLGHWKFLRIENSSLSKNVLIVFLEHILFVFWGSGRESSGKEKSGKHIRLPFLKNSKLETRDSHSNVRRFFCVLLAFKHVFK